MGTPANSGESNARSKGARIRRCHFDEDPWRFPSELGDDSVNGFSVGDGLLAPLVQVAAGILAYGLDPGIRRCLPKSLLSICGSRLKLGPTEQRAILEAMGRHRLFTELLFQVFREAHSGCCKRMAGESLEGLQQLLERDIETADHTFCVLLSCGRTDDALEVGRGDGPDQRPPSSSLRWQRAVTQVLDLREEMNRLSLAVEHEEKRRLRAEAVAKKAVHQATEANERSESAQSHINKGREELRSLQQIAERLNGDLEERGAQLRRAERLHRALLSEKEAIQQKYFGLRRQLREARSRLPGPLPPVEPLLTPVSEAKAPLISELDRRYRTDGARCVMEAKPILLLVDGWNVALNNIPGTKLEDRRLVLEQELGAYEARTGNRVIVVFDGTETFSSSELVRKSVIRMFTAEGETADDCIVSELELGVGNFAPVVVTSDKSLARRCRKRGAFVLSAENFASALRTRLSARKIGSQVHSEPSGEKL